MGAEAVEEEDGGGADGRRPGKGQGGQGEDKKGTDQGRGRRVTGVGGHGEMIFKNNGSS